MTALEEKLIVFALFLGRASLANTIPAMQAWINTPSNKKNILGRASLAAIPYFKGLIDNYNLWATSSRKIIFSTVLVVIFGLKSLKAPERYLV